MNEYIIENYTNPRILYNKISNKLRMGHLVYDNLEKKIKSVNHELLGEIIESEKIELFEKRFYTLPLTKSWLENIFEFESKYNNPNKMTVYISNRNGLNIHERSNGFTIGITFRERTSSNGISGNLVAKPKILYVNELMDYLFLLKRDDVIFNEYDIKRINEVIKV